MSNKVRIVNKTGHPADTKVYVGKKLIPLSKMFKLGIVFEHDEIPIVHLELYGESVDVIGDNLRAIEKLLAPSLTKDKEKK
jgi:hypothetical protein